MLMSSAYAHIAYQLATVDTSGFPHVRTHAHRGFLFPKDAPHAPLLITSTDIRAPKVLEMLSTSNVEAVWWLEGSLEQFRVSGRALVVPALKDHLHLVASARIATWYEPGLKALRERGEEAEQSARKEDGMGTAFDFEKKRQEVFDAMPSFLKAEWARPVVPGEVVESVAALEQWAIDIPRKDEIKTDEDRRRWEAALENFAMVLIEPTRIDWLQLGVQPNRRTVFVRADDTASGWAEKLVVT